MRSGTRTRSKKLKHRPFGRWVRRSPSTTQMRRRRRRGIDGIPSKRRSVTSSAHPIMRGVFLVHSQRDQWQHFCSSPQHEQALVCYLPSIPDYTEVSKHCGSGVVLASAFGRMKEESPRMNRICGTAPRVRMPAGERVCTAKAEVSWRISDSQKASAISPRAWAAESTHLSLSCSPLCRRAWRPLRPKRSASRGERSSLQLLFQ